MTVIQWWEWRRNWWSVDSPQRASNAESVSFLFQMIMTILTSLFAVNRHAGLVAYSINIEHAWGRCQPVCLHRHYILIWHYNDVIMSMMTSQITSPTLVYSSVYSDADQRKHQSSASLSFVRGIHRGPVNSPHKWPVTWKMFPLDDVIMHKFELPGDDTFNAFAEYPSVVHVVRQTSSGRLRALGG